MSTEPQSLPPTPPETPLLERLGTSGKMLGGGAIAGIVALFLPLVSWSINIAGGGGNPLGGVGLSSSQSVSSIEDWRGKLCLLTYVAAIVLTVMLYPIKKPEQKTFAWGGLGAGAAAALLAFWLLFAVRNVGGGGDLGGMGMVKSSIGIGGFLNLIAASVVAYGGFLKAKEERLL